MAANMHHGAEKEEINNIQTVITMHSGMVYRLAYAMMKNRYDADDIYQEVFLRYIRRKPSFQSTEHARAWLLKVTINCCKNHWKMPWADGRMVPFEWQEGQYDFGDDQGRGIQGIGTGSSLPGTDPGQQIQERHRREVLRRMVGRLPEKYRLVIHLYYYEELSTEEIAGLLRRRASTVRTQLTRAREMLKDILEKSGYGDAAL